MRIGGLQKLTLIDYPGKVAATIFTQGCNFRCPFCHNPDLVLPDLMGPLIPEEEVFGFLDKRREQLQGVVISGGEPTLQSDLIPFLKKIKQKGFAVKLDTNGTLPGVLRNVIESGLVDYIAMDVKAPLSKYQQASGVVCNFGHIQQSIELIQNSGISHEFRTTVVKPLCLLSDIVSIKSLIHDDISYRIQKFKDNRKILDPALLDRDQYTDDEVNAMGLQLGAV